ncbi:ABC transporter substrate-binding protein [Afifella sp. IM 167]|uniref:ABC transporter substrate-binding protein n=1 Tax=Afifella sp. IM 167 TaxID=2033586 RepID=UPI001CCFD0F5|nr:ABC transporter substrate-binding protein [Afifella sp. IM 167]MBZ8133431.1 ABC transporter substrate-binding protein [Afifella sp. IM 167]
MFRPLTGLAALAIAFAGATGISHAEPAGTLTVYTSQPTEQMQTVIEAFNKDYPDVDVELFRSGTTEVMNKLQAEFAAGSSPADVVLIADAVAMTQLKNDDRLMAYDDAPIEDIPDALIDPDHTFFGTKLITTGIVYNTGLVEDAPASWKDLTAEAVAAKTIMPSPLYSGAAVIHVGTMVQQPEFGWDYYQTLADNGAVAGQGNGSVIEAVARGEKAYGIIIEYMAFNAKKKGSPVEFVFPAEGVTAISQPVAILKSTDNEEAAKAFVDWQLSKKAQEQSVGQGYFPIFDDVTPPEGYPKVGTLKILPTDAEALLKDDQANKERFAELFGG